ncbi:hypothetical protein Ahy_B09g096289 isoform A [Arachis hypogaea]|uniref:At2g35280-like TPR domain-containing protein n=1 Tax=Arachis hypogaea TaxID=3818 RepID=A0A444XJN4_ARAHY|nr:hypothetical protein Ahy_B09g096289 isoform A [Arachis hypogaea]
MERLSTAFELPRDIWLAIAIKVTRNSIADLYKFCMTCCVARDVGDEDTVLRMVAIPPPHEMNWLWIRDPVGRRFFERCIGIGHPELLFREALRELYIRHNHAIGWEMLQNAASNGVDAAKYALSMELLYTVSMMLMLRDDFESKNKGLQTFHVLEAAGALTICKLVFHDVIQGTWTHMRRLPMVNAENLVCSSHACPSRGNMGAIYRSQRYGRGWDLNDGDGGAAHIPCVHCRADYELILFVHLFD